MKLRILGLACVALACCLTGCATPRIISSDPNTVVIAVPDDSNSWPGHYRDEAYKKACEVLKDPVLVATNRVKVGETVTQSQDTNRRDISPNKKKLGEITTTTSNTTVKDEYEYYLEYRSRPVTAGSMPPMQNNPIQQTGAVQPR